jgi:hypothetical protein
LVGRSAYSSLMMEAVRTSETSVDNHSTRQYNPEDSSEQNTQMSEPAPVSALANRYSFLEHD